MGSGTTYTSIFGHLKIFCLLLLLSAQAIAEPASIKYSVDSSELKNHRLQVEAVFPPEVFSNRRRELALAVWTPGSYKVRDYSRFLSHLQVSNPGATVRKTAKNRWLIEGVPPSDDLRVSYSVYGHELTVRTNYFTPELSLVIGAATFVAPAPLTSEAVNRFSYEVAFDSQTPQISTALKSIGPKTFRAEDFDELADCPIVMGDISEHAFLAGTVPHTLTQAGDRTYWDLSKSLKDAQTLTETIQNFWGTIPYDRYIYQNLITDTRGGLEHRNSTVVMTSRFATLDREKYLGWLSLLSHEFFHTWNVKRLRPKSLGPFDYEKEVYTRSLWIAEGVTSYYDDLLVRRAGLSTRDEYLKSLSKQLNRLLTTPGRQAITLSDASFDAWVRLYQPTDDLHNSNISYYNKGAVVAWLLDTELRRKTEGRVSLDSVMKKAYKKFEKVGYSESEFRALISEMAGQDFGPFFASTVDSTNPLPISAAAQYWGLTWTPDSDDEKPFLGLEVKNVESRVMVEKVFAGSPAAACGLAPGDELLALDQYRLPASDPLAISKHLEVGKEYTLSTARLGKIQKRQIVPTKPVHSKHNLEFPAQSTPEQEALWNSWLGPERKSES